MAGDITVYWRLAVVAEVLLEKATCSGSLGILTERGGTSVCRERVGTGMKEGGVLDGAGIESSGIASSAAIGEVISGRLRFGDLGGTGGILKASTDSESVAVEA
jgi:hypothetical protein